MGLPALVSALYGEWDVLQVFLFTIVLCGLTGGALTRIKPRRKIFYMREGCVTAALTWVLISVMGAVPFVLSGAIPDPIEALFETVSGFTTTGASVLADVESLPMGILFWRSFTHWIGGMGILVFLLAVLPLTGGSHVNLMKAESPGPQVEKMVPSVRQTAAILYTIYLGMTVIQIVFMLAGGCPLMDSLLITFGSAGTGGFGIKNDSMASYSPYIQVVTTISMILFGVNFSAYFYLIRGKFRKVLIEEVRWYFGVILAAIALISWNIRGLFPDLLTAIQQAAFQVGSIITTTGFSTCDFDQWPSFAKSILVLLMFIGACAGSTGGGMKISRLVILAKSIRKEIAQTLHPSVVTPRPGGRQAGGPGDHPLHQRLCGGLRDPFCGVGAAGQPGRQKPGDQLHGGGGHLQQHRPRPGRGGPHDQLWAVLRLFQAGADLRYAGRPAGAVPAFAFVRARDLEKVLTGKSPFSTTDSPLPIFTDEPGASYCF